MMGVVYCPLLRRKFQAWTRALSIVRSTEVGRFWEGPLIEVPLYLEFYGLFRWMILQIPPVVEYQQANTVLKFYN